MQQLKRIVLFIFALLVGSGILLVIRSQALATDSAPIDKTEVKKAFESKNFSSVIGELDKIQLDQKALDNNLVIKEVVSLYDGIDNRPLFKAKEFAFKKEIVLVLYKSRVPLSTETLKRISLTDRNLGIRRLAGSWYNNKRQLPISMQIDTSRYILVDGKGITYEQAYPILVKKLEGTSMEQKINGVRLLAQYGPLLKDKPIVGELIDLYHTTPKVPDKPYREYSDSETKNLTLKGEILLTVAVSGNPSGKDLLNKSKSSSNRYIRLAAGRIETLITTGSMSMSDHTEMTRAKGPFYLMLGKAVPKQEALTLIKKTLQGNEGNNIKNMLDDIGRDPSLIKNTDVYNSLSELLVKISEKGLPVSWKFSTDEAIMLRIRYSSIFDFLMTPGCLMLWLS